MGLSAKVLAVAAAAVTGAFFHSALAADPSYLSIGVGSWETFRNEAHAAEVDFGYRPDVGLWIVRPQVGATIATDGDCLGYAGLLVDIPLGEHIAITPNVSVGGYGGHGFRLGSHVEFRSGADFAWRFQDASRIGIGVYHISNAGLTQRNPGEESVLLEYFLPIP